MRGIEELLAAMAGLRREDLMAWIAEELVARPAPRRRLASRRKPACASACSARFVTSWK